MNELEKTLHFKTSNILGKDTSRMKLNDIIEELVNIIEKQKIDYIKNCSIQKNQGSR